MYKMLALDMDGTLLGSDRKVSYANKEAIKECVACGIKVVLCSGRGRHSMMETIKELQLKENRHIANMGAVLLDYNESVEVRHCFQKDQLRRLITELEKTGLSPMVTGKEKIVYTILTKELVEDYSWSNKDIPIVKGNMLDVNDAFKVTVFSYDTSLVNKAAEIIFHDIETYVSDVYFVDYIPKNTDKLSALKDVAKENGVELKDIIAIGDASLDREMIVGCGFGIAVANSDATLKQCADRVCDYTNDEDAVARAIYKYIFKRPYKY